MKRSVFLTTCLLVLLTRYVFSQNTITREDAFRIIKQKGLVDTLNNNVAVSKHIIPSNTVIKLMTDSIISPSFDSWFFFIDLESTADWAHPCKYIFLNSTDASLTLINHQFPADFPLEYVLKQKLANPRPIPTLIKKKSLVSKKKSIQKSSSDLSEKNYAIIINGGGGSPSWNYIRYWNNCSLVYKTLIEKNYDPENIFVLSSDGTSLSVDTNTGSVPYDGGTLFSQNLDLDGDGTNDIAYSATKTDISTVFDIVENKLAENYKSKIFIYVTDHGYLPTNKNTSADVKLWLWNQNMSPAEFIAELRKLNKANFIQIIMDQCSSGGFSDEIKKTGINAVVATSCAYNQTAHSNPTYGEYIFEWLSGIKGKRLDDASDISYKVDTNHDGFICFEEASEYARKQVEFNSMNSQYYSSPFGCGRYVAIDELQPEAYCYNGKQDNGETGVDCGGMCANICTYGTGGVLPENDPCYNGKKDEGEDGIDCGGTCQPCGIGGLLNNIITVEQCKQITDNEIVPTSPPPSLFSGRNLISTEKVQLSHGSFKINNNAWDETGCSLKILWTCVDKYKFHHCPSTCLDGGIFFEENGILFKPDKFYKITFNFYPKESGPYSQLYFKLANTLVNNVKSADNYEYYTYTTTIPDILNTFYIGNLSKTNFSAYPQFWTGISTDLIKGYYNTISFVFKPDNYYKQLWIYTKPGSRFDQQIINNLKIEEEYFDYSQDVYIQNTTINGDKLIKGRNIFVGNHVTTTQPEGNVLINNGAKVIFDCKTITFDAGFECVKGSTYEVINH